MNDSANLEALFFAALVRGHSTDRAAYLGSACGGNPVFRCHRNKPLNAHFQLEDFLNKPAVEQPPWARFRTNGGIASRPDS